MKLIRYIYKTKTLSEYGLFLFISLIVLLISGNILIPEYPASHIEKQLLNLNGKYFKYNDNPQVSEFIGSVKRNNGYICLGTSETTTRKDGNYYEFLDQDTSLKIRFSVLGGAGRSCGIHIPMLLNHKKEVDSLKIIYLINPVYWRSKLNGFDKGYWIRYNNYAVYRKLKLNNEEYKDILGVVEPYGDVLNPGEKFLFTMEYWLRKIRKPFFQDLRYWLFPDKYEEDLFYQAEEKTGFSSFANFGKIDTAYIDSSWNVSYEFLSRKWLNPISDNDYRNRELTAFIELCNELDVEVTYVLGPVNTTYIKKYHPPYLDGYLNTVNHIRNILLENNTDFIDATDISDVPGAFVDNQHHSSYGAYLIYLKIKNHINAKDSL
ncbi:MAG: hypothetical protein K8R63_10585 [Bacteroidales bacterium]|nr:hypothetical protein [Bacteroidales bacterium]